jgi:hypothetical protein
MPKQRNMLALGLAFVLGGVASPMAIKYTLGVARAAPDTRSTSSAAPSVRKWEQFCSPHLDGSRFAGANHVTGAINQDLQIRGQDGWELVTIMPITGGGEIKLGGGAPIGLTGVVACFRRPVP